jgi:serine/threonine-protein kinase
MAELMFKIANEEAPDVRAIRPEIPEELARIVALMLHKRPELRYQDGGQVALDLRSAVTDGMLGATPSVPLAQASQPDFAATNPNSTPVYDRTVAQTAVRDAGAPPSGSTDIEI